MSAVKAEVIEQNVSFVRDIIANGGETLKKCFQCGNCSIVCEISPDGAPYPRKEMIWAQWGLKDKLLSNPDLWLCHQCNDCTTHCPRGANPGDVMAAVRNISFAHYAPWGLGGLMKPKNLPVLFIIPAVLIGIAISVASKDGFMALKPIVFSNMMPVPAIDAVFLPTVGLAAVAMLMGIARMWSSFKSASEETPTGSPVSAAIQVALGIARHEKMFQCKANSGRTIYHFMLLYGFIALVATTSAVALMYWINKLGIAEVAVTPLELTHPVKILGNLGALLALVGVSVIFGRRATGDQKTVGLATFYDKYFGDILLGTIATGILAEVFRLMDIAAPAFGVYYLHLILVFMLLVYMPFSKFAHMFYRFTALTWAKSIQREKARS